MPRGIMLPEESRVIGERIIAKRNERGVTQQELADAIGVMRTMISYYENAQVPITVEKLLLISRILDTPVTHFLEGLDRTQ